MNADIDLLAAERRGRALALLQNPSPGSVWRITALDSPDGWAVLAGARWAARLGAKVTAVLAAPESPSPVWRLLAESARRQGFAVDGTARGTTLVTDNPNGGVCTVYPGQIPAENFAWRLTLGQSRQFVGPATSYDKPMATEQCRRVDRIAIDTFAVPGLCLMENACIGACAVAMDMLHAQPGKILILAGGGNNGGDGIAMARGFWDLGLDCEVALSKPPASLGGDAGANFRLLRETTGVPVHDASGRPETLRPLLENAALVVDGLLGTGFKGSLSPDLAAAIGHVNDSGQRVLALDIPSGLDGDTGEASGVAIVPERTVTFAAVKQGFAAHPERVGELYLADIGAPSACYDPA